MRVFTFCISLSFVISAVSEILLEDDVRHGEYATLPSLQKQAELRDSWTETRIKGIPGLLRKYGVDAWIISQKEYAEDTAFWSLKSATQFSARRRTLSLYLAKNISSPELCYTWIDNTPALWSSLRSVLVVENISTVAINIDDEIAFSSGLHAGEHRLLKQELGDLVDFRNIRMLAVEFIGNMPDNQRDWYKKIMGTAWAMIEDGFSGHAIMPGITTTKDLEWHLRELIQAKNFTTWFQPSIEIVRSHTSTPASQHGVSIINYGDLLHCDFGITAMGLNTDTQHLAYVVPPNTTSLPRGLQAGLNTANRLQDIVLKNMIPNMTGNAILASSIQQMSAENIKGRIYCHSIGDWGHSAGTVIGMTNLQDGVPILGDLPLLRDTYYSVELYAEGWVDEWNATYNFYQEEDVWWNREIGAWEWVWGRQEHFHLVRHFRDLQRDTVDTIRQVGAFAEL